VQFFSCHICRKTKQIIGSPKNWPDLRLDIRYLTLPDTVPDVKKAGLSGRMSGTSLITTVVDRIGFPTEPDPEF
jgi:hypothetical protein